MQCDEDLFGTPKAEDCYQSMLWISYINRSPKDSAHAKTLRGFAELQYLSPRFRPVKNPYASKANVQLPKIWKYDRSIRMLSHLRICVILALGSFRLGISIKCILAGPCPIALILEPYVYCLYGKPEFGEKRSDILNQVLELRSCLQPPKSTLDRTPKGGYRPLISRGLFC